MKLVRRFCAHRLALRLAGAFVTLSYLAANVTASTPAKPNIIFIFVDDLGYGDIGSFGQKRIKTPNLDRMAAEGKRYTQFYSGSTVCAPARCTLLTGYHTGHALIRGNGGKATLPADSDTLGVMLKKQGYDTGVIGKWGVGGINSAGAPLKQGFDEFKGFISQTRAHNQYPDYIFNGNDRWDLPKGTYVNDLFTTEALKFVKNHKDKPFFLYLPYTIPHQKLDVPSQGIYASEPWPEKERNKAAMITRLDFGVGLIMDELKNLGLDDNTLVFFTSDNGPHTEDGIDPEFFDSNGPLRGIKRDLYEGGIREPMIARWPGKIEAGTTSDQIWALWDVMPTLLDIAGDPTIPKRDGISIKTSLLDGVPVAHGPLYWEFYERGFQQAIRKDDWKLVKTTSASLELYNLKNDIGEQHSVSASHPEVIMELMPLLTSMRTKSEYFSVADSIKPKKRKNKNKNRPKQKMKKQQQIQNQ